jgi:cbb3-type cytochrome oxidase maturation protein
VSILGLLIVVSLALGGLAWWFFVWTVRSGQYEDPEGAKYRMLEDDADSRPGERTTPGETSSRREDQRAGDSRVPRG